MSRFRRVIHSVASGYLSLVATAAYALASVPLALHYLSTERFGLWSLMASIGSYLSLFDLGMSSAVARLLIDSKDHRQTGAYGSLIKTGWLVLLVQGVLVFAIGCSIAGPMAVLLKIKPLLRTDFLHLLYWQSAILFVGFSTRIFNQILQAHQRLDLTNYSQIAGLALNFGLQWFFFHTGQGVFSLVWAGLGASLFGAAACFISCGRLGLFPGRGRWGRVSWSQFQSIFGYGKDVFLVAVGTQLIVASQTMIVTRMLGLEAATSWNVGTRTFNLLSQAVWRIFDTSSLAFSEMIARGEMLLLRSRYKAVVILTVSVSVFAAISFAACNRLFIEVWTHGEVQWHPLNDVLLGLWMIVMAGLHCHNTLVLVSKEVRWMPYVFFLEGLIFVVAALLATRYYGIPGMAACSILCSFFFSGLYGVKRASEFFGCLFREVAVNWSKPPMRVGLAYAPVALAAFFAASYIPQPFPRLALLALLCGPAGFFLFLRLGIPSSLQAELLARAPDPLKPALARAFRTKNSS